MRHLRAAAAITCLLALGTLTACGGGSSGASGRASSAPAHTSARSGRAPAALPSLKASRGSGAAATGGGIGSTVTPPQAMIIQTGTIDVRLTNGRDLRHAVAAASALAAKDGGFVSSSSMHTGNHPSASITLRVPDTDVSGAVSAIDKLGQVTSTSLHGQDVTGQVVDLAAEITNLKSEEKAVRGLLGKAGTVRNILTVQQQLFDLQGQIQELTAQHNSLDNRVQYATVSVTLTTKAAAPCPQAEEAEPFHRVPVLASGLQPHRGRRQGRVPGHRLGRTRPDRRRRGGRRVVDPAAEAPNPHADVHVVTARAWRDRVSPSTRQPRRPAAGRGQPRSLLCRS